MAGNGCPVCGGIGRVLAFGFGGDPQPMHCPECAGLAITPASAEDLREPHWAAPRDTRVAYTTAMREHALNAD